MKIKLLLASLLLSVSAAAQTTDNLGCIWNALCDPANHCKYDSSPAVGCESSAGFCNTCYRGGDGLLGKAFDPVHEFAGRFEKYRYRQYTAERFVISEPGVLAKAGINPGDVVSRISKARATRAYLRRAKPLHGLTVTIYTPGRANHPRRIIL